MPNDPIEWVQYAFFFGGAIGGWLFLIICFNEIIDMMAGKNK